MAGLRFMSNLCVFNISQSDISFNEMNELANRITKLALKEKRGVFFNSFDYASDIIESGKMKFFFLLSDSFIYKNCEMLNTEGLGISNLLLFKSKFKKRFAIFKKILNEISKEKVDVVEIYITTDGSINDIADFDIIMTDKKKFLDDLCESVILLSDIYAYGFPTIKYYIKM